jgi:hypothetical protein
VSAFFCHQSRQPPSQVKPLPHTVPTNTFTAALLDLTSKQPPREAVHSSDKTTHVCLQQSIVPLWECHSCCGLHAHYPGHNAHQHHHTAFLRHHASTSSGAAATHLLLPVLEWCRRWLWHSKAYTAAARPSLDPGEVMCTEKWHL